MRRLLLVAGLLLISAAAQAQPAGWPENLRWDLVPRWIAWDAGKAAISWPPNDGCDGGASGTTVPAGSLIDRFGSEFGSFFSPKGQAFAARAVPYVCRQMDYRVYRVEKPLDAGFCRAASWFGEPGGAVQYQTARPAKDLVADGSIRVVFYEAAGSSAPAPQCGSP